MKKLGKLICFHTRYSLGDEHDFDHKNYSGWAELSQALIKFFDAGAILPIYLLDHSGLSVSVTPFSCPWDSGQIGFIVASKKDIIKMFGTKYCTKLCIEQATELLVQEIEDYNVYLNIDDDGYMGEYDD